MSVATAPRKSKKKVTVGQLIVLCIDGSGSMASIKNETIAGVNDLIDRRRQDEGSTSLSLATFGGSRYEQLHNALPVGDVPPLNGNTYVTDGSTPLYDAIGRAIAHT